MLQFLNRNEQKPALEDILERIEYAGHDEIDQIINAVQRRYSRIFPDWEVWFLSVHAGNKKECAGQVMQIIETLKKTYLDEAATSETP